MFALVPHTSFKWFRRFLLPASACSALLSLAQTQSVPVGRILSLIDEGQLVTLKGATLPVANARYDEGSVASNFAMTDLVLVLQRGPEQQAAFDQFVADQYDPSAPDFHHWLAPDQVGTRFGPALADISAITSWLTSHGFTVAEISKDRMSIRFSGTAVQVENAFHTQIHRLSVNGISHIANMSDPQIPAALAPVVSGVKALHDFLPHPLHRMGGQVSFNSTTGAWQRVASPAGPTPKGAPQSAVTSGLAQPDLGVTVGSGSNTALIEDVTPYDFATIYNVLPLWNSNIDGTGQTIAIAGTSDINPADVATFRGSFGLPAGAAPTTIVANGIDPGMCLNTSSTAACGIGDFVENTLDVEWSGAVAKGAKVVLVVSGQTSPTTDTVYSSANYVIQNNTAKILNVSYGLCELFEGTSGNAAYNNLWETAATEGISVFVASGDSGSPACDQGLSNTAPYGAAYGLSVSGMASTPFNTAVGGTDFNWCKPVVSSTGSVTGCSTAAPYWGTTNTTNFSNAKGYVPEITWNDSCASNAGAAYLESAAKYLGYSGVTDAETACNFVANKYVSIYQQHGVDLSRFVYPIGAGGGASNCTTSDGQTAASCSGGYAKPNWQAGVVGIPTDGKRDIPDVSFFASNGFLDSAYVICFTGQGYTCTYNNGEPQGQEVGGTSVSSPAMAGVMALINQKAGSAQGSPNAELYKLGARQTYSSCKAESVTTSTSCYFNDVDSSTIAMPCQSGALNCTIAHSGDTWGLLSGFAAAAGYDAASGLGSLNVANVVNAWTSTLGAAQATIAITPGQPSISISQSLTVQVSVTGSSGTPTGNVSLVGGGYTASAGALSSGSFTFTIPAYSLSAGSDTLTISYAGDSTYGESTTTTTINVTKLTPTVTVQPNPSTVGANTAVNVAVTVTGSGPSPTGTAQLSGGGYTSSSCTLSAGACTFTIPQNSLTNGTDTLTVTYSGDKVYTTATGTATEIANAFTPTVTPIGPSSTIETDSAFQITVKVSGSGPTPTGLVSLQRLIGTNNAPGGQLVNGSYTFNVPIDSVIPGTNELTVVYSGDSNYLAVNANVLVDATASPSTVTAVPSSPTVYTNSTLLLTGTVSASAGTPSSIVQVAGGGFNGIAFLSGGQYSFPIPSGTFSPGTITLNVYYDGDLFYGPSSTTATVNVIQFVRITPTVTVTPAANPIGASQSLNVSVAVAGTDGQATGSVTLTSGTYSALPWAVINGTATITIPPNTLPLGTDTLSANYSGDPTYLPAAATAAISVNPSLFTLTANSPAAIAPGQQAFPEITASTTNGYSGQIVLSCVLTSQPTGAVNLPTCSSGAIDLIGANNNEGSLSVTTTAATSGALKMPSFPDKNRGVLGAGGAVLAFVIFCFIPPGRRNWRSFLGILILFIALGSVVSCGGGGGGGTTGGGNSGTTRGTYTFTVTGTGNPAVTPAPSTTFTVTVN